MARRMKTGGKKGMRPAAMLAGAALVGALAGGCAELRENASGAILNSVTGTVLGPKPAQTADFVVRSRSERTQFMDVGVTPPARSVKAKTPAEAAATQQQLLGEAQQQQQAGAAAQQEGARVIQNTPKAPAAQ